MHPVIKENIDQITSLCDANNVKSLSVFGSVCTPDFNSESDIDLLVSFNKMGYVDYAEKYFFLADRFEEIFDRSVDLVTVNSLSNPYFIKSINKTKSLVYER